MVVKLKSGKFPGKYYFKNYYTSCFFCFYQLDKKRRSKSIEMFACSGVSSKDIENNLENVCSASFY